MSAAPHPPTQGRQVPTFLARAATAGHPVHLDDIRYIHLGPSCTTTRDGFLVRRVTAAAPVTERRLYPCPSRCGPPDLADPFYDALRCAAIHDAIAEVHRHATGAAILQLIILGPSTFHDTIAAVTAQSDPHALGTADLAAATSDLLERLCPPSYRTQPRTLLVHLPRKQSISAELVLSFGQMVAEDDEGTLFAATPAQLEHVRRLVGRWNPAHRDLHSPLTAEQTALLATTWDSRADLHAQLDAVYAATA